MFLSFAVSFLSYIFKEKVAFPAESVKVKQYCWKNLELCNVARFEK